MGLVSKSSRAVAVLVLVASGIGLAACAQTAGDEKGGTIQDIQAPGDFGYVGDYDLPFSQKVADYDSEKVTVSAKVGKVISDHAFTIAGGDVEPLLIVGAQSHNDLQTGELVKVTGTVYKAFTIHNVEDALGLDFDDELFDVWEANPYIVASKVDTNVTTSDD